MERVWSCACVVHQMATGLQSLVPIENLGSPQEELFWLCTGEHEARVRRETFDECASHRSARERHDLLRRGGRSGAMSAILRL